ncbi:hypothetical protein [Microbulbifer discodermiae]|uniref:hypothetical protein n=1 Tax=Microbulbifer sp. 2201CG32-9 TaxID=3232309 RepID=UPI00345BD658
MCELNITVTVYPELADKVRGWLRRRKELEILARLGRLSPQEADEHRLIDFRLATFARDVVQIAEPQQCTLH